MDDINKESGRTDREIVLRAFTFFQDASNGAGLQMERIQDCRADDARTLSHLWFDWQTLMTHLWRMRKAALLIGKAQVANSQAQKAVALFDKALPNLKTYRDVFEHMESYVFEDKKRHYPNISNGGLQVGTASNDSFSWAIDDTEVVLKDVAMASSKLYHDVKTIRDEVKANPHSN